MVQRGGELVRGTQHETDKVEKRRAEIEAGNLEEAGRRTKAIAEESVRAWKEAESCI